MEVDVSSLGVISHVLVSGEYSRIGQIYLDKQISIGRAQRVVHHLLNNEQVKMLKVQFGCVLAEQVKQLWYFSQLLILGRLNYCFTIQVV